MKRYVREFASDIRKSYAKAPDDIRKKVDSQIQSLLELRKQWLLSDYETVEALIKIPERL